MTAVRRVCEMAGSGDETWDIDALRPDAGSYMAFNLRIEEASGNCDGQMYEQIPHSMQNSRPAENAMCLSSCCEASRSRAGWIDMGHCSTHQPQRTHGALGTSALGGTVWILISEAAMTASVAARFCARRSPVKMALRSGLISSQSSRSRRGVPTAARTYCDSLRRRSRTAMGT